LKERAELQKLWNRDLSTCTAEELADRWDKEDRKAIDNIYAYGFEKHHNPIYFLAERVWFDNAPELLYLPLHRDEVCKFLLAHYMDKSGEFFGGILIMQRDSFKTTFTHGVFAEFIALRGKHINGRDERVQLVHHKEKIASRNAVRLKQRHIVHPWLKKNWPEFCESKDFGTKTEFNWPCKDLMGSEVPSVAATGLSASQVGSHFDWNLFSDPVTEAHIRSKQVRDEAKSQYNAYRYLLDTKKGRELIDGTPYHPSDLHAVNMKANVDGKPLYRQLVSPAIDDDDVLNFPTRHSKAFLEGMRQLEISQTGTDMMFHLQYLCRPKTSGLVATDPAWVQYISMEKLRQKAIRRVLIVDPAWKGSSNSGKGDYAAGSVYGFEALGDLTNRYLIEGFYSREMSALDGIEAMFRLMRIFGVMDVAVEEHGSFTFRTMLEEEARKRGIYINLIDLKSKQTAKSDRIVTFLRHVEGGQFFIVDECSVKKDFMNEYEDWIGDGSEHDHLMDCGGYSCDPNITDIVAPVFSNRSWNRESRWRRPKSMPHRTRHCAL